MNTVANTCAVCKGAGYLRADVPYGHPQFGKPVACACKEAEWAEQRRQQLAKMSNLAAFHDKRFTNFNKRMPGVQEAFRMASAFAQEPTGWLLLVGPNGCGKTHLAVAVANQCLTQKRAVLFVTTPDLLDHLRATFAPNSTVAYDELFGRVREVAVLVIDDLGAEQSSPWATEKLFQLFDHRYSRQLPTVITANPDGLSTVDIRISSRLSDAGLVRVVRMDMAQDYRPYRSAQSIVGAGPTAYPTQGRAPGDSRSSGQPHSLEQKEHL